LIIGCSVSGPRIGAAAWRLYAHTVVERKPVPRARNARPACDDAGDRDEEETQMDFAELLARFERASQAHDATAFAALFAPDGCYDDHFFGLHRGRAAIAAMLDRFHVGGEAFCWTFSDPALAGDLGYASYAFSYRSREPESAGALVMFDGIARFRLHDGLIEHYAEAFDRGMAFAQLGYAPERIAKLGARYARALRGTEAGARHLAARTERLGALA
jgi:hypothetical protein